MNNNTRLFERIIRLGFPQLSKPQHKVMAQLLTAIAKTPGFTLSDIASNFEGETEVKHKLKKLQYFLDGISMDVDFWRSYFDLILCLPKLKLSKRERISIVLSSNNVGPSFSILTASISYRNSPLPVYLKLFDSYYKTSAFAIETEKMLKFLHDNLPGKYDYLYITDNTTFDNNEIKLLTSTHHDYIIRIRPGSLKLKDASDYTDIKLFPDGIYHGSTTDDLIDEINTNIAVISMPGEDDSRSFIYFATSFTNLKEVIDNYSRRTLFEENIDLLKKKLRWENYSKKTPLTSRFEKLLIFSCLSYALDATPDNDIDKKLQHILVNLSRMS